VYVQRVTNDQKCGIKGDKYFVNEVKTQLREKTTPEQPNPENPLSQDKVNTRQ
jgi:hypothetical protein